VQNLPSYLLAGVIAAIATVYLGSPQGAWSLGANAPAAASPAHLAHAAVDRSRKSDRLPALSPRRPSAPLASMELIGPRNTAIVLRDSTGGLLLQIDPVSARTTVAKGILVPEITIRDSVPMPMMGGNGGSVGSTAPARGQAPSPGSLGTASEPRRLPVGCEPPVSRLVASSIARRASRCLSWNDRDVTAFAIL
jgi:hypothetical protein